MKWLYRRVGFQGRVWGLDHRRWVSGKAVEGQLIDTVVSGGAGGSQSQREECPRTGWFPGRESGSLRQDRRLYREERHAMMN